MLISYGTQRSPTLDKGTPEPSFNLLPSIMKYQLTTFLITGHVPRSVCDHRAFAKRLRQKPFLFLSFGMTLLISGHPQSVINAE